MAGGSATTRDLSASCRGADRRGDVDPVLAGNQARQTPPDRVGPCGGYGDTMSEVLFGPIAGTVHQSFGPVEIDLAEVGDARIKRTIYPAGLQWSVDLRPLVGTERCDHAHVGFLAHGALRFQYADGCVVELVAPAVVDVAPGHDAWVIGDDPAVLIEVDFESTTTVRLGVPEEHRHE